MGNVVKLNDYREATRGFASLDKGPPGSWFLTIKDDLGETIAQTRIDRATLSLLKAIVRGEDSMWSDRHGWRVVPQSAWTGSEHAPPPPRSLRVTYITEDTMAAGVLLLYPGA